MLVSVTEKLGAREEESAKCDRMLCRWYVSKWTACSVACGSGIKRREVICVRDIGDNKTVSTVEKKCGPKPRAEIPCYNEEGCLAAWVTGPWSPVRVAVHCQIRAALRAFKLPFPEPWLRPELGALHCTMRRCSALPCVGGECKCGRADAA